MNVIATCLTRSSYLFVCDASILVCGNAHEMKLAGFRWNHLKHERRVLPAKRQAEVTAISMDHQLEIERKSLDTTFARATRKRFVRTPTLI